MRIARGYLQASLHGQRKHTSIVARAVHPWAVNSGDDRPAGEPLFDVLLLGDVAL